jgi:uncharacterized membrane protein
MPATLLPPRSPKTIEASVQIHRDVGEVFSFYRDFRNLPRFLGDVMRVEPTGPASSRWTIQGPFGVQAQWTVRVTEEQPNALIRYETVSLPGLGTKWSIHFVPGRQASETQVREVINSPLGPLGLAALASIGKYPALEVAANLHRLKQLIETGRVTDTRYAVSGKFSKK